ncbi:hypothetical protein PFNF135_00391 [Plasmodium falciparum NF135/5.C10]|uniref:Uncharacterized protein n=2 Tax=Plasmodium falciparum TaxID=5833 RepID=A0A024WY76_PLAFA|nr:hypothetical protein PFNF135_00391 [Plasmodium falciparum NF135/5.C10]ETW51641.1 hypothetical protein PFMALIP_00373 [Plasmodium falciparum MaliPS096_E11]
MHSNIKNNNYIICTIYNMTTVNNYLTPKNVNIIITSVSSIPYIVTPDYIRKNLEQIKLIKDITIKENFKKLKLLKKKNEKDEDI